MCFIKHKTMNQKQKKNLKLNRFNVHFQKLHVVSYNIPAVLLWALWYIDGNLGL